MGVGFENMGNSVAMFISARTLSAEAVLKVLEAGSKSRTESMITASLSYGLRLHVARCWFWARSCLDFGLLRLVCSVCFWSSCILRLSIGDHDSSANQIQWRIL